MTVGHAFSDHIKTEKIKRRHFNNTGISLMRGKLLIGVLGVFTLILLFQLVKIQIVKGSEYRVLSDSNRTRTEIIYAPRGVLFDRNNKPLVFNQPGFRVINGEETKLISREKALDMIAQGATTVAVDSLREYPFKDALAHVIGYTGQITKEELESEEYSDYHITDFVGKTGIESKYERFLRGMNGRKLIEVDATGKEIRMLGQTDPVPGNNLVLTIDAALQQATYEAMKDTPRGAVVVSTPDGEILTLLSKPSFDPNLFTLDETYKVATDAAYQSVEEVVLDGKGQPLLDRAVSGVYPPGSTFKIVTAAAGLNKGIIDESYQVKDTGIVRIGAFSFANWFFTQYGRTDGDVNVVKGLGRSNDIFFYKLAEKVGVDNLSDMAGDWGIGQKLGIDLAGEQAGILPSPSWKRKTIGEQWYLGDTYHYGIGQGYLLTTPLQVNAWTQAIVNDGKIYQPHLLKNNRKQLLHDVKLSEDTVSLITEGMIEACSDGGTAYPLFNFAVTNPDLKVDGKNILDVPVSSTSAKSAGDKHVVVACKTGTAQHGGEETLPHAWITLFAPAYNPEIIVTVLAEEKGEGSAEAGPIAKKILDAYFGTPQK